MVATLDTLEKYIPLSMCADGWLYEIKSRNLTLGVFRKDKKGFIGIREKFGHEYLFVEDHWDTGAPFGTVKPQKRLERCPVDNLDEFLEREDGKLENNKSLFDWLLEKDLTYIGHRESIERPPGAIVLFGGKRDKRNIAPSMCNWVDERNGSLGK